MKHWLFRTATVLFVLFGISNVQAQEEITLIAPNIMREPIDQLIPIFEAKTGHNVKATFGAEDKSRQQVISGEAFDVPLVEAPYDRVISSGNVVASSQTPIVDISVGVAIRKGATKPDISTPDAVKQMLLAAKGIAFPDPAPAAASGIAVTEALKKLGIEDQLRPKIMLARGGARAMALVASGDAEIGMTFLPGMTNPDIEIVGTLPSEICPPTVVVGFVSSHAKDPAAAKQLLAYLSSAEAGAAYKAFHMNPAR